MHANSTVRIVGLAAALLMFGALDQARAAVALSVDLAGIESRDGLGSPGNVVLELNALPGARVNMVSWDLTLTTQGASWLSEATMLLSNSAGAGVAFSPGYGDDDPGSARYSGSASLVDLGVDFSVLADGRLYLEFYETFDDNRFAADAIYERGSITLADVGAVPEPAGFSMLALGLLGLAATAGRRRPGRAAARASRDDA